MKKFLTLAVAALVGLASCSKDDPAPAPAAPDTLDNRLVGTWDLTSVTYSGTAPNPLNPTQSIPFSGTGTNTNGGFTFSKNPNEMDFDFGFTASANGMGSFPISRSGSGTWTTTSDGSRVILTPTGEDDMLFDVILNQKNKQVWSGTLPYTLPAPLSITILVDAEFTLEK